MVSLQKNPLNNMGETHNVVFDDDVLMMNPGSWVHDVESAKVAGFERLRDMGFHICAVIDNAPRMLDELVLEPNV